MTGKQLSDKTLRDVIKYVANKNKIDEDLAREIVVGQFKYAKENIVSGTFKTIKLILFGKFNFSQLYFNLFFNRVSKKSYEYEENLKKIYENDARQS